MGVQERYDKLKQEISRKDLFIGFSIFILSVGAGMATGNIMNQGEDLFSQSYNIKVNSDESVRTVEFDNHSLDILMEDRETARFYLDYDRDGSADRKLNLTGSNSTILVEKYVTLDRKSYSFSFEYHDNPAETGEARLTLVRVERIQ